jgi:hypothetical protein
MRRKRRGTMFPACCPKRKRKRIRNSEKSVASTFDILTHCID